MLKKYVDLRTHIFTQILFLNISQATNVFFVCVLDA